MTVREYISQRFSSLEMGEADYVDAAIESGLDLDAEYEAENALTVGRAMCSMLASVILAPRRSSINEQGFSMSMDFGNIGKYYMWLCRKYGVKADSDVLELLGQNTIIDRTNIW